VQFTSLESFDTILIMEIFRNLYANQGGILSAEKGFLMELVRDHYNTEMHFTAVHADLRETRAFSMSPMSQKVVSLNMSISIHTLLL